MMERVERKMAERRMRTAAECPPLLTGRSNGIITASFSVADPVPGSGAFLTLGSGIRDV
jgi:hypothetical protein